MHNWCVIFTIYHFSRVFWEAYRTLAEFERGECIMIIDKTTGKGCAWRIASKTITKKLLAENILNKLIFRKPRLNRYDLFRVIELHDGVYVMSDRGRELSEKPLWIPSFIDADIWKEAVSRFRPLKNWIKTFCDFQP